MAFLCVNLDKTARVMANTLGREVTKCESLQPMAASCSDCLRRHMLAVSPELWKRSGGNNHSRNPGFGLRAGICALRRVASSFNATDRWTGEASGDYASRMPVAQQAGGRPGSNATLTHAVAGLECCRVYSDRLEW